MEILLSVLAPLKSVALKTLANMLLRIFTQEFIVDLVIYSLEKLVNLTDNQVDNELVAMVKSRLGKSDVK